MAILNRIGLVGRGQAILKSRYNNGLAENPNSPYYYNHMKKVLIISGLLLLLNDAFSQTFDTTTVIVLSSVTVEAQRMNNDILVLSPFSGTYNFSGKKNEVIAIMSMDANITEKTGRQLFAKVPGVFVYDFEGGNQINIATRGLDPHRGWEFNLRKDGIITNSDMYAYPASHYSIPMESIENIELVRGTASLQYGGQFGGMLNYITKQGDTSKPINFESFNTAGSYNLLSTYNAMGGKINKVRYYAYYTKRTRDGFRENEHTDYDAQGINLTYEPGHNLSFRVEWVRSNYLYQIPGPLTDAMFLQNPRQATRFRNYFNPTINIPSVTIKWDISEKTKLQYISSAVIGQRKSVIYDRPATIPDTINTHTLQYNNRQVDIDSFNSYTQELRLLHNWKIANKTHKISAGVQLINNHLHRNQLGKGTTGTDYDLTLVDPVWGRDMHFKTRNIALFAENAFIVSSRLRFNVGARWETGESNMNGKIVYLPENEIPVSVKRQFPLFGASFTYEPRENVDFYGGISQNYRPVLFKDVVPGSIFEKVDPNLKDASGFNAELGYRGSYKFFRWDISGFILKYNDRFGTLAQTDAEGNFYSFRTNIGNSTTRGIELLFQGNWALTKNSQLTVFTSTSIMDGQYTSGGLKLGDENVELKGNRIESVPGLISRNGITYQIQKLSISGLLSHTGKTYADPFNTEIPNSTGTVGLVPAYTLIDVNTTYKLSRHIQIRAGINNITNKQYFTKRPMFYPGPGIWPSDGRNGSVSFIFQI